MLVGVRDSGDMNQPDKPSFLQGVQYFFVVPEAEMLAENNLLLMYMRNVETHRATKAK